MRTSSRTASAGAVGLAADRFAAVARHLHLEALEVQDPLEHLAYRGLVIDDQDAHTRQMVSDQPESNVNRLRFARCPRACAWRSWSSRPWPSWPRRGVIIFTRPDSPPKLGANGFAGGLRPAIPPKDFTLRDQDGRMVSLRALRGQVVVLTFMYSTCQDTCPVTATTIRGALDDLGHDVPALAVSVDPAHDTPNSAEAFLVKRSLSGGRMRFLLGRAHSSPPSGTTTASSPRATASSTPPTCC